MLEAGILLIVIYFCKVKNYFLFKGPCGTLFYDSTYRKVQVVGRLDFELRGMQSQNISKYSPKIILWNLQYLILKLLERFGAKTMFSCQN